MLGPKAAAVTGEADTVAATGMAAAAGTAAGTATSTAAAATVTDMFTAAAAGTLVADTRYASTRATVGSRGRRHALPTCRVARRPCGRSAARATRLHSSAP